jgi:hypothetical protein
MSELRVLRERNAALADRIDRALAEPDSGSQALLVNTAKQTTYPTSPGSYFACNPTLVTGDETEGSTPSFLPDPNTWILAYNVGSQLPAQGTMVVVHLVGGRYVFRYSG